MIDFPKYKSLKGIKFFLHSVIVLTPFDRPHTIFCLSSVATMSLSCTVSDVLSVIPKIKRCHVTPNTSVPGYSISHALVQVSLHTKFQVLNPLTHSKSMYSLTDAPRFKVDHIILTMPLSGLVCHPRARTYDG